MKKVHCKRKVGQCIDLSEVRLSERVALSVGPANGGLQWAWMWVEGQDEGSSGIGDGPVL